MKNKNFILRLVTGSVYVALVVGGIFLGPYAFVCLFSIVVILCLKEFYGLVNAQKRAQISWGYNCFGGLLLFLSAYLYVAEISPYFVFFLYLLYVVSVFVGELYEKRQDPLIHSAYIFLGQIYIALPLSLLNMIAFSQVEMGKAIYHPLLILALFVFIWINDSGAYVTGMLLGKHQLFKRISPNKTWEGFAGGLLFTIAVSFVFAHFERQMPLYHWIGLAVVVVIFATWGDLVESLMKRTLEIKDSGKILPGHGGFLDRFDSLLVAIYGVLFYMQLFIRN
ncbi:MAG: phosphatidate cytidylyltransferase [Candidatus Azobacteroides sp.]|nr:phosphatidate cytidylyltransferase [Candidatus Azobacteroides sp.]